MDTYTDNSPLTGGHLYDAIDRAKKAAFSGSDTHYQSALQTLKTAAEMTCDRDLAEGLRRKIRAIRQEIASENMSGSKEFAQKLNEIVAVLLTAVNRAHVPTADRSANVTANLQ